MSRLLRRYVMAVSALLVAGVAFVPAGRALGSANTGELWVARYNGPASGLDEGNSVAVSPDGSKVFVTGRSSGSGSGYDYATTAHDAATGAPLWVQRYNGPGNSSDEAFSVAVTPDGSKVVVTGYSFGSTTSYDYATVAYDAATGTGLWSKRYNGLGNVDDYGRSVGVSPDGSKVFVTGYSYGGAIDYDYATVAYDAGTGAQLWERRYDGTGHDADYAYSLAVSPDGSKVYVTGYAYMTGTGNDYVTTAIDAATGVGLWGQSYNGPGNSSDYSFSVDVSPDGSKVFVTGYSYGVASGYDYATVALNAATGGKLWFRRYNGPGNSSDYGQSVAASPDGSKVFVTGYGYGSGSGLDYATLGYNATTGAPLWARRYNGPGNTTDEAFSVDVTPDSVYVYATGYASSGASGYDYATVAYLAATGGTVGVKRYNGPGNGSDYANWLTVSPDGSKAFVTGQSYGGVGPGDDYATAAYQI